MKKLVLLFLLPTSLFAQTSYQDSIQKPIKYISSIYQEVSAEFEGEPDELLGVDSLIKLVVSDSSWHSIESTEQFQLLGLYDYYWEEVLGSSTRTTYSGNIRIRDTSEVQVGLKPIFFGHPPIGSHQYNLEVREDFPVYSGKSMIDSLYLPSRSTDPKASKTNGLPVIFERDDLNNTRWTVFQNEDYLMLRKVHSYPNGNMTSFYSETLVFFRAL